MFSLRNCIVALKIGVLKDSFELVKIFCILNNQRGCVLCLILCHMFESQFVSLKKTSILIWLQKKTKDLRCYSSSILYLP